MFTFSFNLRYNTVSIFLIIVHGSFKERGARYALLMLSDEKKKKGVISASLGNHALALCYHGKDLKIPVTVVMPIVAPIMKIQSCRQHGASVVVQGDDMGEAKRIAMQLAKERELTYINGYDHPHIMAGQGTLGLEIVEQVPNIDAVVVPVGGGGLIAGVALAVKTLFPHIKIIGVESERCASFSKAVKAGMPVYTKIESTLADGLAVPMVGYNAFATAAPLIDKLDAHNSLILPVMLGHQHCLLHLLGRYGNSSAVQFHQCVLDLNACADKTLCLHWEDLVLTFSGRGFCLCVWSLFPLLCSANYGPHP
uniref:Serine racemase n=1 Tax=Timema cristinae TaxID=61476 RepID=A0A7R9CIK5_TIMCR|nr:unnamed protein product [Timema cristinae]